MAAGKGWMDAFDEITYNAEVWLPGTDSLGKPNGSVRTYGVWTAKNPLNGNIITTKAYHSFEFNPKGQIHELKIILMPRCNGSCNEKFRITSIKILINPPIGGFFISYLYTN